MNQDRSLRHLVPLFVACSLVHFTHNAEFPTDYPSLPGTWSRTGVYLAWVGLSAIGLAGWLTFSYGYEKVGLSILVVYALLGIESLGHYVVASFSAHTLATNATILLEVGAAALLLVAALHLAYRRTIPGRVRERYAA